MRKEFIFDKSDFFQECHASTLVELPGGGYMAAWFGGTKEGKNDVAIWGARRFKGIWEKPVKLAKVNDTPHWNPVLFCDGNIVYLYFKTGTSIRYWMTRVMLSGDNGSSWTEPQELVFGNRGGRGPVKNKPIILSDGTWAAPASFESKWYNSFVDLSNDKGKTWIKVGMPQLDKSMFYDCISPKGYPKAHGVIQPALWESSPGNVHMLLRSSCGHICRSDSSDYGLTWNKVYKTDMPNNNSGLDVVKIDKNTLLLICNPVAANWGKRTPVSLFSSKDNGISWRHCCDLETNDGEYSYPSIIRTKNGFALVYTWNRKKIVFAESDIKSLENGN